MCVQYRSITQTITLQGFSFNQEMLLVPEIVLERRDRGADLGGGGQLLPLSFDGRGRGRRCPLSF